jgi:hypothetical protein
MAGIKGVAVAKVSPRGQRVLSANNSGRESQRREEHGGKEVLAADGFVVFSYQ